MLKKNLNYFIFGSNILILLLAVIFVFNSTTNGSSLLSGAAQYEQDLDYGAVAEMAMPESASEMSFSRSKMKKRAMAPARASSSNPISSLMINSASASENKRNNKYIIKNGNLRGRVDSLEDSKNEILVVLKKHKAYIFSENESNSNYSKNLSLSIKVPAESFDAALNELSKLTIHLDSKSSDLRDVMKQFVETEERIKNQNILRDKFRKLIVKSKRVEDTLKIEQQLSQIQTQIEYSKKILENLKDQIAVSTISANFYEQKPVSNQKAKLGFGRQILDSLSNGWNKLRGTVLFIISVWPFIIILLGLVFSIRLYIKKSK